MWFFNELVRGFSGFSYSDESKSKLQEALNTIAAQANLLEPGIKVTFRPTNEAGFVFVNPRHIIESIKGETVTLKTGKDFESGLDRMTGEALLRQQIRMLANDCYGRLMSQINNSTENIRAGGQTCVQVLTQFSRSILVENWPGFSGPIGRIGLPISARAMSAWAASAPKSKETIATIYVNNWRLALIDQPTTPMHPVFEKHYEKWLETLNPAADDELLDRANKAYREIPLLSLPEDAPIVPGESEAEGEPGEGEGEGKPGEESAEGESEGEESAEGESEGKPGEEEGEESAEGESEGKPGEGEGEPGESEAEGESEGESAEGESEGESAEGKPGEGKPGEGKPGDDQSSEGEESAEGKGQIADGVSTDPTPSDWYRDRAGELPASCRDLTSVDQNEEPDVPTYVVDYPIYNEAYDRQKRNMERAYDRMITNNRAMISALADAMAFPANDQRSIEYARTTGDLDESNLWKIGSSMADMRLFEKADITDAERHLVVILLDLSGSMKCSTKTGTRISQALDVCGMLVEAIQQIKTVGVEISVYGHTGDNTGGRPNHPAQRDGKHYFCELVKIITAEGDYRHTLYGDNWRGPDGYATLSQNYDGLAIRGSMAHSIRQHPTIKGANQHLFIISDGLPEACGSFYGTDKKRAINHTSRAVAGVRKTGASVLGIGIDNAFDAEKGTQLYGSGNYVILPDVASSAKLLAKAIRKACSGE